MLAINKNIGFTDYVSRICLLDCFKLARNQKNNNDVTTCQHDVIIKFFDVVLLLSSLVTGPSFMPISSLILELWQFSFIRDWPEIQKLVISLSGICPISAEWGELGIPNLAWISLMKCYWMLQNTRVTAFTISESLKENQHYIKITHPKINN